MSLGLIDLITSTDDTLRHRSLDEICATATYDQLLGACEALEAFRLRSENLYERVRALFFLYAIHRFHLPARPQLKAGGRIPFAGYEQLLQRRFGEAIELFSRAQKT